MRSLLAGLHRHAVSTLHTPPAPAVHCTLPQPVPYLCVSVCDMTALLRYTPPALAVHSTLPPPPRYTPHSPGPRGTLHTPPHTTHLPSLAALPTRPSHATLLQGCTPPRLHSSHATLLPCRTPPTLHSSHATLLPCFTPPSVPAFFPTPSKSPQTTAERQTGRTSNSDT